jgi:hypothetical protein
VVLEYVHKLEDFPPKGSVDFVKFRLVYDGPLPPEGRGQASVKQQIRKQIHPQLKHLWEVHPVLKGHSTVKHNQSISDVERIATQYERIGYRFVPLVRESSWTACRLSMLILMRDEPHRVFAGDERGDLDNRIKTLIDGLKMPKQLGDLGGETPAADENPFYCLLEDDKLIYEFDVIADRLLVPHRPGQNVRDVVAVIGVHVTTVLGCQMTPD